MRRIRFVADVPEYVKFRQGRAMTREQVDAACEREHGPGWEYSPQLDRCVLRRTKSGQPLRTRPREVKE